MESYNDFLERKAQLGSRDGFAPIFMPDCLFDFQGAMVEWAINQGRSAMFADCGLGKGQPEGAQILTPRGFVSNMEINVGDMIIGSDGSAYPLKAKYRRGMQSTYRICFSDGSDFVVDSDHLHIVRTNNDRQRGKPWRVMPTTELLAAPLRYGGNSKSRNFDIPIVAPVQGRRIDHWIHPYIMGVLLGDGCLTKHCTITLADLQIVDTVRSLLPCGWTLTRMSSSKYDYVISKDGANDRTFITELRRLGIHGLRSRTKFIPQEYLMDAVDNRVWLLRGLMDTDGWIKDTSQYYTTSGKLADNVLMLIRSLGGVPTRSIKHPSCMHKGTRRNGAPCHVLTFSLKTFNPFHLARKASKWNAEPRDNGRWIDRIEPLGSAMTVCLSVGSPDHSYVTENYIVTHNTLMQLVWAENVVRKHNKPVLVLTPLAVAYQTKREATRFGIDANVARDGKIKSGINIINYEQLHHFSSEDFAGAVCDESAILKSFDGVRRREITDFMRKMRYRLLCTATPSPNEYTELGTSSEALGHLGYMDMLSKFFRNDQGNSIKPTVFRHQGRSFQQLDDNAKWRLKGHAEIPFWRWVCSWARAMRKPSDLGFDDGKFILPPLTEQQHEVHSNSAPDGMLFALPAFGLAEQREERRRTIQERCEYAANLVAKTKRPAIAWCHLNDEGDLLERLIKDSVQVSGADADEAKEEKFMAFVDGKPGARVLITKDRIGAWGLNFQHCSHSVCFPTHSFESYYQSVRRCWRFGQKRPVKIDIVATEGEKDILKNLQRKANAADKMFSRLIEHMHESTSIDRSLTYDKPEAVPQWV